MADFEEAAKNIGQQIFNETKTAFGEHWAKLSETNYEDVARASRRVAELTLQQFAGEDVDQQMRVVKATVKNWQVTAQIIAASALEEAFWKGVEVVGQILGTFLVNFAKKAIL